MQCEHHTPGSLPKSVTAMTLQHSVHVPHARPGTTRDKASASAAGSFWEFVGAVMPRQV
jgi:hypothetical protein